MIELNDVKIQWTGHDGFLITTPSVRMMIDPFQIDQLPEEKKKEVLSKKVDLVICTHPHSDHLSPEDVKLVSDEHTILMGPDSCKGGLSRIGKYQPLNVDDSIDLFDMNLKGVVSYNTNKDFHKKSMRFIGVIITFKNGKKLYHAGDTDVIEEMNEFGKLNLDIALLPVSGTYTMTAEEAVTAAGMLKAKVSVPMHYGSIVGEVKDAELFVSKVEGAIYPTF